ncbi:MAG: hypothetical protein AB3N14_10390 [Flavobacteriaceae bacterium]
MKNVDLVEMIRAENPTLDRNVLDWCEYIIYLVSYKDCAGGILMLSSLSRTRRLSKDILDVLSFNHRLEKLCSVDAKVVTDMLYRYGVTKREYSLCVSEEYHPVEDAEELSYYQSAMERISDAEAKFKRGDIGQSELDAVLYSKENMAVHPITGNICLPLVDHYVVTDYYTDLVEIDPQFAVVELKHLNTALSDELSQEVVDRLLRRAKQIAVGEHTTRLTNSVN